MWQNDVWNNLFYLTIKVIVIFFIWYVKDEIVDQNIRWFEFMAWDWSINFDILPLICRNVITQGIFVAEINIISPHPNIRFEAPIKEPTPSVIVVIFVVVRVIRPFPRRFAVVHSMPEFVFNSYLSVSTVDLEYSMTHGPWTTLLTIGNISYHFPTESFFHESTFSWLQHLVNGLDWFSNCYSRKKTFQHSYIVKWGCIFPMVRKAPIYRSAGYVIIIRQSQIVYLHFNLTLYFCFNKLQFFYYRKINYSIDFSWKIPKNQWRKLRFDPGHHDWPFINGHKWP